MTRAVLILRPQPGADETAARARARGLEPVVAPLFSVRPLAWTVPDWGFDAVLFTSANAPRHGGDGLAAFRALPCYAVGEATALAAAEAGFGHVRTGPSDGAAVVQMMARDGIRRALHPTGAETTELPTNGIEIVDAPVYSSDAAERLSDVAVAAIHAGAVVMVHSPRAAALLSERIGDLRGQTRIAAISDAAAAAAGPGWAGVGVALEPRDDALLAAADELADTVRAEPVAAAAGPPVPRGLDTAGGRRPWLLPVLIGAGAFLLGILAMAWVLLRWDAAGRYFGIVPEPEAAAPTAEQQRPLLQPLQPTGPADLALAQRLAALEQRLGELGTDAQAAVGNADRAEGLLVAFAARRALERGVGLGYLEGLLRQRFGASQAEAVGTVIDFAQKPVTLQQLQAELTEVGPRLTGGAPDQSFWQAISTELTNLVVVRRDGTASTDPRERLQRASARLEAGQVEEALLEVLRLPGRENGRGWIDAAQRYVASRQALDAIELAAFVEQRTPAAPQPLQVQQRPATTPDQAPPAQPPAG
ncbi:MAG TPA: uroporphyrinogen-III synthase [Allosphingosinicella sp.]|nr:uroporphyrinogen-III synthase [Allosphingosinicella sp.]